MQYALRNSCFDISDDNGFSYRAIFFQGVLTPTLHRQGSGEALLFYHELLKGDNYSIWTYVRSSRRKMRIPIT